MKHEYHFIVIKKVERDTARKKTRTRGGKEIVSERERERTFLRERERE